MTAKSKTKIITSSCQLDCGARCILKVYVENGKIISISTDDGGMPGVTACPKGLLQKDVVYAKDRLHQPLKRVGARGSGKFEPVTWDEALDTVAGQLKRVKENYGADSIFLMEGSGYQGPFRPAGRRFFSMFGGNTISHGSASNEAARFSSLITFGTPFDGTSQDNFQYSKLIIMWGWNPVVTRFGSDRLYYLQRAKKNGAKIISVDPRYTISARALAGQWIPIKPGTDAAMLIAMAYVMIEENLCDYNFLERFTVGFDKFKSYVIGDEDGVQKTPAWAENISGVPQETIKQLARDYATIKPAALFASWAAGRSAFGEQYHRAASTLAAMTGNIGIKGGYASGGVGRIPFGILGKTLPVPERPVPSVHITKVFDALLKEKADANPNSIKLLYIVASNLLTQFLNINKGKAALQNMEFIVAHEQFLTPTARYADIVLPVSTALEREDIAQASGRGRYFIHLDKAVDPLPETRSDLAIFTELASRLGISGFNDKTDEEWLKEFAAATPDLPDFETFKSKGVHVIPLERPWMAFKDQIENPDTKPFPTPSGKIEIYSQKLADRHNPLLPPIPKYIPAWDGVEDPLKNKYPIQLVSPHSRARVNSSLHTIPSLKALADDSLWLNTGDAAERGINDGDAVSVFNDRGQLRAKVKVTHEIMPGVASLDAGMWFEPNKDGVDTGGCMNVLTRDEASPGGAFTCNSCLVQIKKVME